MNVVRRNEYVTEWVWYILIGDSSETEIICLQINKIKASDQETADCVAYARPLATQQHLKTESVSTERTDTKYSLKCNSYDITGQCLALRCPLDGHTNATIQQ